MRETRKIFSSIAQTVSGLAIAAMIIVASTPARSAASLPKVSADRVWQTTDEAPLLASRAERLIVPRAYRTFRLEGNELRGVLDRAPLERVGGNLSAGAILTLPMPDGTFSRFAIYDSPIMEPELAASFPEIKTYSGQGLDDPTATIRLDWTPQGFHAMVISASGTVYVDPYSRGDKTHYISYDKRDFEKSGERPRCLLGDQPESPDGAATVSSAVSAPGLLTPVGTTLRTYRLAVAADVEYTTFHGGTVPLALGAVTTTINRVTGIYERDLAVRLVLVASEASIIYTSEPDPYTNSSPSTLLAENQANLDAVILSANYDIGHVFTTGGGGLASLGVVCTAGTKARSETGSPAPVGDPYDVDYVSHEMGHQFGARHSFNGTTGNCGGGNRTASAAYEPGSGSTIMGYAGICGVEDLQPNSDDYFHTKSFDEIVSYVGGGGSVCPTSAATGNLIPTVEAGPNFTIPISTPFVLTAAGSDPNGDSITYCWEEFDLGTAAPPNTDDGSRPIFRSFDPVVSPSRTFPRLADIISGVPTLGESLPTTNRTMTFRATVRDNRANGGGVNYDSMQVTSTTAAGPFVVTQPNTALTWVGGTSQTVTWNVAGTTAAPVSTANVKISLSIDDGLTFPTVLAASTANDGSELVTIPNTPTNIARVKVEAVGNIYFDMSNVGFNIIAGGVPFLNVGTVTTTLLGPDGDASLEPGESGRLAISLVNNGSNDATNVSATLTSSTPGVTVVTSQAVPYPNLAPTASAPGSIPFQFTVSSSVPCGTNLSFTVTATYAEAGGPAVRAISVPTGEPPTTTTFSYAGAPVAIPDASGGGANATIAVAGVTGTVTDVNFAFDGTSCSAAIGSTTVGLDHTWVGDLVARLTAPSSTAVTFMSQPGGAANQGNNFCQTVLDDSGPSSIQSIAIAGAPWTGTFQPASPLSAFNNQNPNGTWTLNVADLAAQDTGSIRKFSLRIQSLACNAPLPTPGTVPEAAPATPLTVSRSGADLTLDWGASCNASGVDYAIYQGTIGTYFSHTLKFCTTQGLLTKTFPADSGSLYFLVVPLTADREGSYGKTSALVERPQGTSSCKVQLAGSCP
jgi:subtilisin-like proprotein convertase family protein